MTNAYSLFLEATKLGNNPIPYRQPHPYWCVETCYRFLRGLPAKKELFLSEEKSEGIDAFQAKLLGAAYGLLMIESADYETNWEEGTVYLHFTYLSGVQHSTLLTYTKGNQLALTIYDPATGAISRKATSQVRIDRLYRIYAAPQMADIC
jgi:hypothetical protein